MKIYKVTWRTPHEGCHIAYAGNKKEIKVIISTAKKDCSDYFADEYGGGGEDIADIDDIETLNVPTDKKGLINFLRYQTPNLDNG